MNNTLKKFVIRLYQEVNKKVHRTNWYNLRSIKPISNIFGLDRGKPIDRYYIEKFLDENKSLITGTVLEIAENIYSNHYGHDVEKYEILNYTDTSNVTIIGDLTNIATLPQNTIDCFICTQTYNFIYDFKSAIRGTHHLLKNGGIVLATVAGISQISKYDMDRWGDYWKFTTLSAYKAFSEVFGENNVKVTYYGNVLSSIAFLEGISCDELTKDELDYKDPNFQLIIAIIAKK